jgi:hypothetical protein
LQAADLRFFGKKGRRAHTTYIVSRLFFLSDLDNLNHDSRDSADTMTLFILTETSAGYALLKAKDKKLLKRTDVHEEAATAEGAAGLYDSSISVSWFPH